MHVKKAQASLHRSGIRAQGERFGDEVKNAVFLPFVQLVLFSRSH